MAGNINNFLSTRTDIGKASADLTNIKLIIGGGGVVKPNYFRDGFALLKNYENNIHNHLAIDGSQNIHEQLKNYLKILPPITFTTSDTDEDQGKKTPPTLSRNLFELVNLFRCSWSNSRYVILYNL